MEIAVTHSSTACVLLEIGPLRILTDPVLDEGRQAYKLGPAAWATRYIGPAIDLQSLPPVDAILLSHAHHLDNLDERGLEFVRRVPLVITGHKGYARVGESAKRLRPWEQTSITAPDGFTIKITATPAKHGPWFFPESWSVIGFVLEWEGQQQGVLYISGDTLSFLGLHKIPKKFKVGVAFIHLGGVHFWPPWPPFLRFTFSAYAGAKFAKSLKAKTIIPIHYERSVWSHFREPLESYHREFADRGLTSRTLWLSPGKRTAIDV